MLILILHLAIIKMLLVYIIAFEDLPISASNKDYNDIVVKLTVENCNKPPVVQNTPPTITLIGSNPLNLTVGDIFTDPGATANDAEDGNLTSQIVRTGNVNASTTGSYLLTYVVKDSGNLYATTTRTVIVNGVVCTVNCGGGGSNNPTVSLVSNPNVIIIGATSTLSWTSTNTNFCSAIWTTATSTSGSKIVSPATTTDYVITCLGSEGSKTATTTIVVNPIPPVIPPVVVPPVTPPSNTDGGGGGSSSLSGGRRHNVVVGEILGATSCAYLRDYLKIDWQNDKIEVLKLQSFLNVFEKEKLSLTGVFNQATYEAVERFQTKYSEDILVPWGDKVTKGFVYILTKKKVNEIYCNSQFPVTLAQQNEIDAFRAAGDQNLSLGGVNLKTANTSATDLAASSSNDSIDSVIKNIAVSLFALSPKIFADKFNNYSDTSILLLLILIALIIIIIKLFV